MIDSAYGLVPKGCVISYQHPPIKVTATYNCPPFNLPDLTYPDIVLGEREDLFFTSLNISIEQSKEYEVETRKQSDISVWHELRKYRLTASKFKDVCSRQRDFSSLSNRLLKKKSIQTAAMKYGIEHEDAAADLYSKECLKDTYKVGLVINPSVPHLGCSPDRRVYDEDEVEKWGLLEIKCSMAEHLSNLKYLKCNERTGKYSLKKNHQYYYQVMGCLGLTGSCWSDFFVYCKSEFHCERIYFDEQMFNDILTKLNLFYFNYHLSSCVL